MNRLKGSLEIASLARKEGYSRFTTVSFQPFPYSSTETLCLEAVLYF